MTRTYELLVGTGALGVLIATIVSMRPRGIKNALKVAASHAMHPAWEEYGEHGLTRKYRGAFHGIGGFADHQWDYKCKCGERLSDGPEGGLSINAVCEKCKINYGCLPGYYGEDN